MTVGLLSTIWMIDMIDRVMIGLALPMIGDEFSLSNTQLGGVVSIFAIFYMLGQVPGGMLADRFGPRPLLIVALILWSVFTALTGFAWGLVSLMVMRAMFGLSQGLFPAASFKALAERTRPKTRATAMRFMIGANNLGPGIAPLIIAPVLMAVGWRDAFWLVAIVGAVIGTVVWLVLPRRWTQRSRKIRRPHCNRSPVNTHAPRYSSPFRSGSSHFCSAWPTWPDMGC